MCIMGFIVQTRRLCPSFIYSLHSIDHMTLSAYTVDFDSCWFWSCHIINSLTFIWLIYLPNHISWHLRKKSHDFTISQREITICRGVGVPLQWKRMDNDNKPWMGWIPFRGVSFISTVHQDYLNLLTVVRKSVWIHGVWLKTEPEILVMR